MKNKTSKIFWINISISGCMGVEVLMHYSLDLFCRASSLTMHHVWEVLWCSLWPHNGISRECGSMLVWEQPFGTMRHPSYKCSMVPFWISILSDTLPKCQHFLGKRIFTFPMLTQKGLSTSWCWFFSSLPLLFLTSWGYFPPIMKHTVTNNLHHRTEPRYLSTVPLGKSHVS